MTPGRRRALVTALAAEATGWLQDHEVPPGTTPEAEMDALIADGLAEADGPLMYRMAPEAFRQALDIILSADEVVH